MKKAVSVIFAVILALSSVVWAFAAGETDAELYNIYGDDMLFQQNEKAVLSGTAASGSEISCKVYRDGELFTEAESVSDGEFEVEFDAPAGGYDEYTIEMYQNGTLFDTLTDVVFGELWIAGGQSNMHIYLRYSETGMEMIENNEYGSRNIRVLDMPLVPSYSGDMSLINDGTTHGDIPCEPQKDIAGADWFCADCEKVYDITGVGYFFAEKLQKELDMPVGILCDYLGGSSILPWLSRKAIDSDSQVRKDIGSDYIKESRWKSDDVSAYSDMTALYNIKTAPLTVFHVAGMIWYQGESDCSWEYGRYSRAINLLQNSLSEDFDCKGKMPFVISSFADNGIDSLNTLRFLSAELGEFVREDYSSRSLVTLSDISLEFTEASQAVHPITKKPVGERMALAAMTLVYGRESSSACAPILKSSEIRGSEMYLTFENVGDGLVTDGKKINGFTICGKNGVYLPADAEIVSADTVKISNPTVENPVAAMFSQGLITQRSNLYSSENGEKVMPANHSITDRNYTDNVWQDFGWTDCDNARMWRYQSVPVAGYYDVWKGGNADVTVTPSAAYSGEAGLEITSSAEEFSVAPITDITYGDTTEKFINWETDWKNYSSISIKLKNSGTEDINFDGIKIYVTESLYFMPDGEGTDSVSCLVPADGQWHTYTFDLENLRLKGKGSVLSFTRKCLGDVDDVSFCFSGGSGSSLCLDDISFASYENRVSLIRLFGFDLITFLSGIFKF